MVEPKKSSKIYNYGVSDPLNLNQPREDDRGIKGYMSTVTFFEVGDSGLLPNFLEIYDAAGNPVNYCHFFFCRDIMALLWIIRDATDDHGNKFLLKLAVPKPTNLSNVSISILQNRETHPHNSLDFRALVLTELIACCVLYQSGQKDFFIKFAQSFENEEEEEEESINKGKESTTSKTSVSSRFSCSHVTSNQDNSFPYTVSVGGFIIVYSPKTYLLFKNYFRITNKHIPHACIHSSGLVHLALSPEIGVDPFSGIPPIICSEWKMKLFRYILYHMITQMKKDTQFHNNFMAESKLMIYSLFENNAVFLPSINAIGNIPSHLRLPAHAFVCKELMFGMLSAFTAGSFYPFACTKKNDSKAIHDNANFTSNNLQFNLSKTVSHKTKINGYTCVSFQLLNVIDSNFYWHYDNYGLNCKVKFNELENARLFLTANKVMDISFMFTEM